MGWWDETRTQPDPQAAVQAERCRELAEGDIHRRLGVVEDEAVALKRKLANTQDSCYQLASQFPAFASDLRELRGTMDALLAFLELDRVAEPARMVVRKRPRGARS